MSTNTWLLYGAILVAQNLSFTIVSRARNSGSLKRHVVSALMSNGVWFVSQLVTVEAINKILNGSMGWRMAVFAAVFYTVFTVLGSVVAHYIALRTEKGKSAVGANDKYVQITKEEWDKYNNVISELYGATMILSEDYRQRLFEKLPTETAYVS